MLRIEVDDMDNVGLGQIGEATNPTNLANQVHPLIATGGYSDLAIDWIEH
jgi:hypothetical protein